MVADSSSRSSPKQEVVVVGASFAGRRVAQLLSSNAGLRVTLVDRHEFWEYTPSVLRALVEPSKLACILQRHPPSQPVVVAEALEVQVEDASPGYAGCVRLSDGGCLPFHYLVLATGSGYAAPIKPGPSSSSNNSSGSSSSINGRGSDGVQTERGSGSLGAPASPSAPAAASYVLSKPQTLEDRTAHLKRTASQLARASHVLVVGGGTVGVELAAEVAGAWGLRGSTDPARACGSRSGAPGRAAAARGGQAGGAVAGAATSAATASGQQRRVTLVSSDSRLLPRMPPSAGAYALRWLQSHGVEVVLGERVMRWPSHVGKLMGASSREGSEPHQGLLPLEPTLTSSGRSIGADLVFDCTGLGAALHTQLAEPLFPRPTADGAAQQGCQQQGREAAQGGEHRGREEDDGPSQQGDGESQQVVQGPGQAQAQGQAGPPQGTVSLSRGAPSEGQAAAAAAGSLRKGGIPVESTLQVRGHPCIFACGDVAASPWERTAYAAELQAACVAKNLQALAAGRQLVPYPQGVLPGRLLREPPTIAAVSLWKWDGVVQFNKLVMTGPPAAGMKAYVEFMQLGVSRGSGLLTWLWLKLEALSTFMGGLLFR